MWEKTHGEFIILEKELSGNRGTVNGKRGTVSETGVQGVGEGVQ